MKSVYYAFLLLAGVMLSSAPALAAEQLMGGKEHICTNADLVGGVWKMMKLTENPQRKEFNWFKTTPYQYLTFYENNQYSYDASNTELTAKNVTQIMHEWPRQGKHTLQYMLSADGVLDLYMDKQVKYRYRCVYVAQSHDEFVKGDLKLNGYSTQYHKGKVYKLYRRWF